MFLARFHGGPMHGKEKQVDNPKPIFHAVDPPRVHLHPFDTDDFEPLPIYDYELVDNDGYLLTYLCKRVNP